MSKFKKFLEQFHELLGLPLALAAFVMVPALIYYFFGPEAGAPDPGNLNALPWAALFIIFASLLSYWGARLGCPGFYTAFSKLQQQYHSDSHNKTLLLCAFAFVFIYLFFYVSALWLLVKLLAPGV